MRQEGAHTRSAVAWRAVAWGLAAGVLGGAVGGTVVIPLVGTVLGAGIGFSAALIPTLVGTCFLVRAAGPGTDPDSFARRATRILIVVGVLTCIGVVGFLVLRDAEGLWYGPATLAVVVALGVLVFAGRSITALRPVTATPDRAWIGIVAGLAVVSVLVGWAFAWAWWLNPDARGERRAADLRNSYVGALAIDPPANRISSSIDRCYGDYEGEKSYTAWASGVPDGPDAIDDALDRAAEHMRSNGLAVRRGTTDPPRPRSYVVGTGTDVWVIVERNVTGDQSVRIQVTLNCPPSLPD